jgi:hypothetical protein
MRVIIAGTRSFTDYPLLNDSCKRVFRSFRDEGLLPDDPETAVRTLEIVSGTAKGADLLGEHFANGHSITIKRFPADWETHGKSAGYLRNEKIAMYAKEDNGTLISFWDGVSSGTKHMIDLAQKHGLRVYVIKYLEGVDVWVGGDFSKKL